MKRISFLLAIVMSILFWRSTSATSQGKTNAGTSTCRSVDAVILIDQSGSMHLLSDPNDYRISAAQDIIHRFALNAGLECQGAYHRIAVGNFGDKFNWTNFSPDNQQVAPWIQLGGYGFITDQSTWEKEKIDPLLQRVVPLEMNDRPETDTLTAIKNASLILKQMASAPLGDLPRIQTIIIITDGNPYLEHSFNLSTYMNMIQKEVGASPQARVFVVALNLGNSDYLSYSMQFPDCTDCSIGGFWNNLVKKSDAALSGELIRLSSNQNELTDQLNQIYEKLMGIDGVSLDCGSVFYIEPYIQSATFTFSKNNPDLQVALQYLGADSSQEQDYQGGKIIQNGTVIEDFNITNGEPNPDGSLPHIRYWGENDKVERYILTAPIPGAWKVTSVDAVSGSSTCPDVKVRYAPLTVIASLSSPTIPLAVVPDKPYYDPSAESYFEVKINDQAGKPVSVDSHFPLFVSLTYTDQNGNLISPPSSNDKNWILKSQANGIWRSDDPIPVPLPGHYSVEIQGTSPSADPTQNKPLEVFHLTGLSVNVLDVNGFSFKVEAPRDGDQLPVNTYKSPFQQVGESINVSVQMYSKGKTLSSKGVITGDQPFRATLKDSNGETLEEIKLQSANDNGLYTGTFRSNEEKIDPDGKYTIQADLIGQWDTSNWQPSNMSDEVTIQRNKVDLLEWMVQDPTMRRFGEISGGALFIVLLGLLVFECTGGPDGSIQFLDNRGDLLKGWKLSPMRAMNFWRYKSAALKDVGIEYAQFKRGFSGKDTRAVHLKVVNDDGAVLWNSDIQANMSLPITPDISVQYFNAKHKEPNGLI